ncbi:hypothetical protein QFZ30_002991 [Arthrobacter pascens]|uniref:hypothetical protein n=1 Tax=Arthrobacter pascens TaxID=1677 RepID=UPI0027936044|nr:hypothetical protein [Arthrobacter pascens]MDQ0679609.1 hypothetical protein [Arthrobacter pascens]
METLKKIVRNQYFPAAAVLIAVLLFWAVGLVGGLSMLNDGNPPIATLTWMLFVYMAAVITPLAGVMAAIDLVRRWRRNRQYELVQLAHGEAAQDALVQDNMVQDNPAQNSTGQDDTAQIDAVREEPVQDKPAETQPAETKSAVKQLAANQPAQNQSAQKPARNQPAQSKPAQAKSARKKAA